MKKITNITKQLFQCFAIGIAFSMPSYAQTVVVPTNGMIAHYDLDGNGIDGGSDNISLTPRPGMTTSTDRFSVAGGCYNFNGTTSCLYLASNGFFHQVLGNDIAISFWYKTNNSNSAGAGIVDNSQPATSNGYGIDVNNGNLRFIGGGNFQSATPLNTDNQWHHVLFNKAGSVGTFYIDGAAVASSSALTALTQTSVGVDFNIGRRNNATNYFIGDLDDVRVYNRSLTAQEINTVRNEADYLQVCASANLTTGNISNLAGCTNTVDFNIVGNFPVTIETYATPSNSLISSDTSANPTKTFASVCPGNYYAVLIDNYGCRSTVYYTVAPGAACAGFSASINTFSPAGNCSDFITFDLAGTFPMNTQTYWANGASGGNILVASASPYTVSGLCPENYYTVITDGNGCADTLYYSNNCANFAVTFSNVVDASAAGACDASFDFMLSGTGSNACPTSYYMIGGGSAANNTYAENNVINVSVVCAGDWVITADNGYGCSVTDTITINQPLGLANLTEQFGCQTFLDPAQQLLTIKTDMPCSYTFYDINGRPLQNTYQPDLQHQMPVADLPSGLYVLVVTNATYQQIQRKVVISR